MNTHALKAYQPVGINAEAARADSDRNRLLLALAAAAFLVFFNGFMVAPLIPTLGREFSATPGQLGWLVPAYMLPYGLSTLFYGPLSDRFGRRNMLLGLAAVAVLTSLLLAQSWSIQSLIGARVLAGLTAGGIVTIALSAVGDMFPFRELGRAMGWMFGAIAGGMAFGVTIGAWLNPVIGWRNEFLFLAAANAAIFILLYKDRRLFSGASGATISLIAIAKGFGALLKIPRGRTVYTVVFLNGLFHGGVFSWLALYLTERFALSDASIGKTLIGYGLPGLLLGPVVGRLADRFGRAIILPVGFLIAAAAAFLFVPISPLWFVAMVVPLLSLGLDMTHPLMAGIVASLDPQRRGQAMGFNAFALFTGLGLGAILFQTLLRHGFPVALTTFGVAQLILAGVAVRAFKTERRAVVV